MARVSSYVWEMVATDKLQNPYVHQIARTTAWRLQDYVTDFTKDRNRKNSSVWIRQQKKSANKENTSLWMWSAMYNDKASSQEYAKDYEWGPWIQASKNPEQLQEILDADNKAYVAEQEEEHKKYLEERELRIAELEQEQERQKQIQATLTQQ